MEQLKRKSDEALAEVKASDHTPTLATPGKQPLPYQFLCAAGPDGTHCVSRGGSILTFSVDGTHLSTWHHPSALSQPEQNEEASVPEESVEAPNPEDDQAPPSKRRKTDDESEPPAAAAAKPPKKQIQRKTRPKSPLDSPCVVLLKSTDDGKYIVAVTGQDKTVWVLEHVGRGELKELSQRPMPKRPCDVAITADGQTILTADKFGDVHALPLIPSGDAPEEGGEPAAAAQARPPVSKGANPLTVHTQRNLQALEHQARQRANNARRDAGPAFAHQLLLGHVSMLTCIAVAAHAGKPYILTGDRDEHVRVSRGMPQAHVIENFCLGHASFVSAMCLPEPGVLVSGGGDDDLFVWDWFTGSLKAKVPLLDHAKLTNPDADKVAVAGLTTYNTNDGVLVIARCDKLNALFIYKYKDGRLTFARSHGLTGAPLDVAVLQLADRPDRLVVTLDDRATGRHRVEAYPLSEDGPRAPGPDDDDRPASHYDNPPAPVELSFEELDRLLYTVEPLRKTEFDDGDEGEAPVGTPAAAATAAVEAEAGLVSAPQ